MSLFELHMAVSLLNSAYADCIDSDRLEAWPDFFTSDCFYSITTQENLTRGWEAGLIFADSQGMLKDRVSGLREANIYERHSYRHIISMPAAIETDDNQTLRTRTPFAVYRVMRNGSSEVFVTGCYRDELRVQHDGTLKIARRVVVCDSSVFDVLLAIPL